MTWTTPSHIREQVNRLWQRGEILASMVTEEPLFPKKLAFKKPRSSDLSDRFDAVRGWIGELAQAETSGYRIVWTEVRHRVIGKNALPHEIWVDTTDEALGLIGRRKEAARFSALLDQVKKNRPELVAWLEKRPLKALEHWEHWPHFLNVITWLMDHPRPGIYMRQIDLPGVHTKFIEAHRGILSELLDLCLPEESILSSATGTAGFCQRYGFLEKPITIRFRLLDPDLAVFATGTDQDISVSSHTFARLSLSVDRVFITENEVNFLAFPRAAKSMVIFGKGYGFEMLKSARWLEKCQVFYWGDIDTHGFAILDQLRATLPHTISFLMDDETFFQHRALWGSESSPETRELPRLSTAETALYDALRFNRLGSRLRLEQERLGFGWIMNAIKIISN